MTTVTTDWHALQRSWDLQQEGYLPDREERLATMLDLVAEVADGRAPRILDLACGTGTITLRALARFHDAEAVAVDADPVLLRIAEGTFAGDQRVTVVRADLRHDGWARVLRGRDLAGPFDAILTATALHWLDPDRLAEVYADLADLLRPGGLFCNADHHPIREAPRLSELLSAAHDQRVAGLDGDRHDWHGWWEALEADPAFSDVLEERRQVFPDGHSEEANPGAGWHLDALRAAGFSESAVAWRTLGDAIVAGIR